MENSLILNGSTSQTSKDVQEESPFGSDWSLVSISSVSKHWPAIPASTRTGDQRRKERLSSPTVLTSLRDSCFYSVGFLCLGITPHNSILHFPFLCLGRKQNHHLSPLQRVFSLRRKKKWMESSSREGSGECRTGSGAQETWPDGQGALAVRAGQRPGLKLLWEAWWRDPPFWQSHPILSSPSSKISLMLGSGFTLFSSDWTNWVYSAH